MNKFNVGDRVVLTRPNEVDTALKLSAGMEGTVVFIPKSGAVGVRMDVGRSVYFRQGQLEHAPQEAPSTGPSLQERRERIATAVLAGLAGTPNAVEYRASYAKTAVEWADALIKELGK